MVAPGALRPTQVILVVCPGTLRGFVGCGGVLPEAEMRAPARKVGVRSMGVRQCAGERVRRW